MLEQQVTTQMQKKWILKLMGYDFIIEYKQGKFNQVANGLSRKGEEVVICALTLLHPNWWDLIVELHETNMEIKSKRKGGKWGIRGAMIREEEGSFFQRSSILARRF